MPLAFTLACARHELSNYSVLAHRGYDGYLASMHQSGTHWLKFMLALALARRHDLPPPRYNHANDIIGGTRDPRPHGGLPRLVSTHSIPNWLARAGLVHRLLHFPAYVVLVRDVRSCLVSNHEKWKQRHGVPFAQHLRGDPSGRRYNSDLWWCIRFLNAWGEMVARYPDTTLVVRYEALQADALAELRRIDRHWGLDLDEAALAHAVAGASKREMQRRHDPDRPAGEVRTDERSPLQWFSPGDHEFLRATLARHLRHDFGYRYDTAPTAPLSV